MSSPQQTSSRSADLSHSTQPKLKHFPATVFCPGGMKSIDMSLSVGYSINDDAESYS